jgi:tetratricopeptide (TPR) repeat protein
MPDEDNNPANANRLTAVFDLDVVPPTFDIFPFLISAEILRRQLGCDSMHVLIVPASSSRNTLGIDSPENIAWRVRQIIIPALSLIPSCGSFTVCEDRAQAEIFLTGSIYENNLKVYPENYSVGAPTAGFSIAEVEAMTYCDVTIPTIQASKQALLYATSWLEAFSQGRIPISITLREANNAIAKNSNLGAWAQFVGSLNPEIYFPFIIRDTDRVFEPADKLLSNYAHFSLPAVNLELRAAIYEKCYLNLVGAGGPIQLCMFDQAVRFLVFNIGKPGWSDTKPESYRENYGIEIGQQLRVASQFQRLVWGEDRFENIKMFFALMVRFIENGGATLKTDEERSFFSDNNESIEIFAERMFVGRQWGPARKVYRHILLSDPDNSDYNFRLGVAETWGKNPTLGLEYIEKSIKLGFENAEIFIAKGEALLFLGRLEQAAANFQRGLLLDQNSFDGTMRMGVVCEMQEQIEEAKYWIEKAIEIDPNSPTPHQYLGAIFLKLNEAEKAEAAFLESERLTKLDHYEKTKLK